jgi:hypothetical protein
MAQKGILSLSDVLEQEAKLEISKGIALRNAIEGNDVDAIYQAQKYLKNIEKRELVDSKSLLVDPLELSSSFGYKNKPFQLSYDMLRGMARTHIVKSIVETRKDQLLEFCEPQVDKFGKGFVIEKKRKYGQDSAEVKLSKGDQAKIEWLIEFLMNCGETSNVWHSDTFDVFVGKIMKDSLELDQATFEVVRDRKGQPVEFFATDAATFRIADTYNDDVKNIKDPSKIIQGYAPSYVQLYMGEVVQEFYPWELSFGIRNPSSDIRTNGYGRAEMEDMVTTITALLNSDAYNANFFKVGSSPKGIIRYSGNVNQNTLEDFRRQWQAQVAGVMNAHKTPIINADKMDFINTHVPNKDMEFSKFQEFLIKITCAIYKIDPSEVGFPMSGNSQGTSGLGGSEQEEKVQYSKDKGLVPLAKKLQYWINKHIIWPIDPSFNFRFVGLQAQTDEQTELDRDILGLQNFTTLNEVRQKRGMKPLPNGDMPLNPVYLQAQGMAQQQEQQNQQSQQDEQPELTDEQDPFLKSLSKELEILLNQEA